MLSTDDVLGHLRTWMEALFEVDPNEVQLDSRLNEDLDIDSIDAVDIAVKIRELTGSQVKPEDFKSVRTVADVVEVIQNITRA